MTEPYLDDWMKDESDRRRGAAAAPEQHDAHVRAYRDWLQRQADASPVAAEVSE